MSMSESVDHTIKCRTNVGRSSRTIGVYRAPTWLPLPSDPRSFTLTRSGSCAIARCRAPHLKEVRGQTRRRPPHAGGRRSSVRVSRAGRDGAGCPHGVVVGLYCVKMRQARLAEQRHAARALLGLAALTHGCKRTGSNHASNHVSQKVHP